MTLAVVVVNYNRWDYLDRCLASVQSDLAAAGLEAKMVVVDNASRDGSPRMVREAFGQVHLIENAENRGFAAAANQGIAATAGPYILLLNNDTEVLPGALAHLLDFAARHPDAGAVGCTLLRADGSAHRLPASVLSRLAWFPDRPCRVVWLVGAALLLRREALAAVGGLDEGFFFYYEDWDLGLRLRKAGWRSYYTPGARILHYERASTALVAPPATRAYLRAGRERLARRHFPWMYPAVWAWRRLTDRAVPATRP